MSQTRTLFAALLVALSACSGPTALLASPSPTPTSSPLALPTPRAVRQTPQVLIIGLSDFPLSGYLLSVDEPTGTSSYRREFKPASRGYTDYYYITIDLYVMNSEDDARGRVSFWEACTKTQGVGGDGTTPKEAHAVSAPTVGTRSVACAFSWVSGVRYDLATFSRNVALYLQIASPLEGGRALDQAGAIARKQFEIVDRLSPP